MLTLVLKQSNAKEIHIVIYDQEIPDRGKIFIDSKRRIVRIAL